jgi:hypothetical protein
MFYRNYIPIIERMNIMIKTSQEDQELFNLCEGMDKSKKGLLDYIGYFHGKQSEEYEELNFLIQEEADLKKWMDIFQGNVDNADLYNLALRRWKIDEYIGMRYEGFMDLMELDVEDGVETFFQQRCGNRLVSEIEESLGNGMTWKWLWEMRGKNGYRYARVEYLLEMYKEI